MTKGDLMKKVYTEEELGNVDSTIDIRDLQELQKKDKNARFWYVMDYNDSNVFGKLTHLGERYKEKFGKELQ